MVGNPPLAIVVPTLRPPEKPLNPWPRGSRCVARYALPLTEVRRKLRRREFGRRDRGSARDTFRDVLTLLLGTAIAAPYTFGDADGTVRFHVESSAHGIDGRALRFRAVFDPQARSGSLTIPAASLSTGLGPRDQRLWTYALEAARFPELGFVVTKVEGDTAALASGTGSGDVHLLGTLTIRDVSRAVDIPVRWTWEGPILRLHGRTELRWADFGVPDPSVLLSTVEPQVAVAFDLVGRAAP